MPIPVTATIAQNQKRAMDQARATMQSENHGATTLVTQDRAEDPKYLVYVYNVLDREYIVNQPPLFPSFHIPACAKGERFSVTVLPAFVNEVYSRSGTTEYFYKPLDGRKAATSLLNPSAYPGTNWESQVQNWEQLDQFGNNLNAFGVFWSLTRPDETAKLEVELGIFRERATKTMQGLITIAEDLHNSGDRRSISPLMHYAMEYLGKSAAWHTSLKHMVNCPNCGDSVQDGIAYHRNAFGEKCIIDQERYAKSIAIAQPPKRVEDEEDEEPAVPKPRARRKAAV